MKFNLHKFLSLVKLLGPAVLVSVPGGEKIAPHVDTIVNAIGEAEQIKGASGAEKKARVLSIVQAGVKTANATGKVQLDPLEVQAIASDGIDAVIGTVHVIEGAKVVKAPPPVPGDVSGSVPAGSTGG